MNRAILVRMQIGAKSVRTWVTGELAKSTSSAATRRPTLLDAAVAFAAAGVDVAVNISRGNPLGWSYGLLTAAAGIVLVARRVAPTTVLVAVLAATTCLAILDRYPLGLCALVALYTVAEVRAAWLSLTAFAVSVACLATGEVISPPVVVAVWVVGILIGRTRRDIVRDREQLAREIAQAERTSIARELHDVVAHSVSVMLVAVRGARDALTTSPEVADETLAKVELTAEQSLTEMRRVLFLLRTSDGTPLTGPQPSLSDLESLASDYDAAGLRVRLDTVGDRQRLAQGIELSAYRIVQEGLTNAVKHGGATAADVTLTYGGSHLVVEIADNGTSVADGTADGHGLTGMRERATLLGGTLQTHNRPNGGYRVCATLPYGSES